MKRRLAAIAFLGLLSGLAGCRMAHEGMSVDRAESGHYPHSAASRASPKAL